MDNEGKFMKNLSSFYVEIYVVCNYVLCRINGGEKVFFLYLCLWIIFNGNMTLEIVIIGTIIAAALTAFMCKFGDYSMAKEKHIAKKIGKIMKYAYVLIKEIIKANISVIHLLLLTI